jgi:enoyl-CoA hydratase/carnithine racemase
MEERSFKIEDSDGTVTLTFDWPQKANTLGRDFARDCLAALDRIDRMRGLRVLIVTGAGKVFCGGGDLNEIMGPEPRPIEEDQAMVAGFNAVAERLFYFRVPVIAAVNGPAAGGGAGIAMACDIAIASEAARYDIFFGRLGLSGADVGVPWLLTHLIGPVRASYYMFTAGSIDAATGLSIGAFAEVTKAEALMSRAHELGRQIAEVFTPLTAQTTKTAMRHGARMEFRASLAYESYLQTVAFQAPGHKQRIAEYRGRISKREKT